MATAKPSLLDLLGEHLRTGELLDLQSNQDIGDRERSVAAKDLREVLMEHRRDGVSDPRGIRVRGLNVAGRLDLNLASLEFGIRMVSCRLQGGLEANQASFPELVLIDCLLTSEATPALLMDRVSVTGQLAVCNSQVYSNSAEGAPRLQDAQVGSLDLRGSRLRNSVATALYAERMQSRGQVMLSDRFAVQAGGKEGAVRLLGARIGDDLLLHDAAIEAMAGPALLADRVNVSGNFFMDGRFQAISRDREATIRLVNARIGSQLGMRAASISNASGPAIDASGAQVDNNVYLDLGFEAFVAAEEYAVKFLGAKVGGQISMKRSFIRNTRGPAIGLSFVTTGGDLMLDDRLRAEAASSEAVVDLTEAKVGGQVSVAVAGVRNTKRENSCWDLNGLTYRGIPQVALEEGGISSWLDLIRLKTPCYVAQPYQQLAASYRAEGHDSDVRTVQIAQRGDQVGRGALTRRTDRFWVRLTGLLLGYGYQPWRALICLLFVLLVSVASTLFFGTHGALVQKAQEPPRQVISTSEPASLDSIRPCSIVDQIARGLDLGAPFLPRVSQARCEAASNATGAAASIASWVLQACAWGLAALFVAGFTGIVRKP